MYPQHTCYKKSNKTSTLNAVVALMLTSKTDEDNHMLRNAETESPQFGTQFPNFNKNFCAGYVLWVFVNMGINKT